MATITATTTTTVATDENTNKTTPPPKQTIIGSPQNFWLHSTLTGYDLTHPPTPTSPPIHPRLTLQATNNSLSTTTTPIALDPSKTALLIIDMQNFFLSPAFNRDPHGPGHSAMKNLVETAIPAARKAGIRVIWVNWGLTRQEVEEMPPAMLRAFGAGSGSGGEGGKDGDVYVGLGGETGLREDVFGGKREMVEAGRLLMRDQWNSGLYGPLAQIYEEGKELGGGKGDVWIHKNRMSALWSGGTELGDFLEAQGIRSLLFSGVNTDQCVGGTLQDAFSKGFDCVLLKDAAGTSSPGFAQEGIEYNAGMSWGFVTGCQEFDRAVEGMVKE